MSGLVETARNAVRRQPSLDDRAAGLATAVEAARGRLDDDLLDAAAAVVTRTGERMRLSAEHTVVALAGATGSGKSSTFNALAGVDLAAVGVRRPTTATTTACVWGDLPADELLDWLGVPPRHRVTRDSSLGDAPSPAALDGLLLLDLPDHDSVEVDHHLEVERLTSMADLMVWVLDPQKYADAAIHRRFLAPLARHRDVILVVLNRIDEVPASDRAAVLADARRLLDVDGLDGVPLLTTVAPTGEGVDVLRAAIAERVAAKAAARARLAADVEVAADRLAAVSGDTAPPELRDRDRREVLDALADAAGVPLVVDAVRRATTVRARRATGWPVTAWLSRLRPDPLKRLHLDVGRTGREVITTARTSLPAVSPVQRARVDTAVRGLSDRMSRDLAEPWARAIRRASTSRFDDLEDALDRAMTERGPGPVRLPWWTGVVRLLQWALLLTALAGAAWLGVLATLAYLQVPAIGAPDVRGVPLPTLMLLGGVGAGILLALLSRFLVGLLARSRARVVERRLRAAVDEVTERLVVAPLVVELEACRDTRAGLRQARR